MSHDVGVWIDHKKPVIVFIAAGHVTKGVIAIMLTGARRPKEATGTISPMPRKSPQAVQQDQEEETVRRETRLSSTGSLIRHPRRRRSARDCSVTADRA
jgi:hypothetical protein